MARKANIMVTFILIAFLAVVVFSLYFVMSARLKGAAGGVNYTRALYIAEAGVNKAIWNVMTPTSKGGKGTSWRTFGTTEQFDIGRYTMVVASASNPDGMLIMSTGEAGGVARTVQVRITASQLPAAFDYALYNNGNLTVAGDVTISGDIFANGNATVNIPATISGEVYVPEGNTISGNGTYGVGGTMTDPPQMPFLDTSYYDGEIASATGAPAGDATISGQDLNGQTIYVNGNAVITGSITGTGKIVATGNISFEDATTAPDITFIAGDQLNIAGTTNIGTSIMFASNSVSITGTPRITGSILSATVKVAGTPSIFGIIYAWEVGVTLGTANIYGAVINPTSKTLTGNVSIVYDPAYLPAAPPPGMTAGGYRILKGSWKEL